MVENQSGQNLKRLRLDNGGQFQSDEFIRYCQQRGIRQELTTPYSPELNDIVERMNRTIQERIVTTLDYRMAYGPTHYLRQYT